MRPSALLAAFSLEANLINTESPTIITIDNLLSKEDVQAVLQCIETECVSTATTSDYQEDIFRVGAEEEEDQHFADAVDRARIKCISTDQNPTLGVEDMPSEHANSPLEQFLWLVMNHPNAMDQEDIVTGANFVQRRNARQRWESEGGRQLLELSMDEEPFARAGKRYEMPSKVKDMLLEKIVRQAMPGLQHWNVQDATVVKYSEGESQVPHVDQCDATILCYLESTGLVGGATCFPVIGCRVPAAAGTTLLFFSSSDNWICFFPACLQNSLVSALTVEMLGCKAP